MTRYWVSWYSGNYAEDGCTKPPFKYWCTGYKDHPTDDNKDLEILCAVIDAYHEDAVWSLVFRYFPDYTERFCEEREHDYVPSKDRFPQ